MSSPRRYRIWLLTLVPPGRYGRWWAALAILMLGAILYGAAAILLGRSAVSTGGFPWSITLFFVCSVAYIVPMFHYIMTRTHKSVDDLGPYLAGPDRERELHEAVERRSLVWAVRSAAIAIALWLLQSYLLSGSWANVWWSLTSGYVPLVFQLGPLVVWLAMYVAMSALVQNAMTFRRLVPELSLDLFEPDSYLPVGRMAVTSTLVSLGGMALMSIMWLGGPIDWWTTLPALVIFTPLVVILLLVPVWPVHRRLVEQRRVAVADAQRELRRHLGACGGDTAARDDSKRAGRASALLLRREVARMPVWPFDAGAVARFMGYAVIVPLTWAGAALIEMLVNALLE